MVYHARNWEWYLDKDEKWEEKSICCRSFDWKLLHCFIWDGVLIAITLLFHLCKSVLFQFGFVIRISKFNLSAISVCLQFKKAVMSFVSAIKQQIKQIHTKSWSMTCKKLGSCLCLRTLLFVFNVQSQEWEDATVKAISAFWRMAKKQDRWEQYIPLRTDNANNSIQLCFLQISTSTRSISFVKESTLMAQGTRERLLWGPSMTSFYVESHCMSTWPHHKNESCNWYLKDEGVR